MKLPEVAPEIANLQSRGLLRRAEALAAGIMNSKTGSDDAIKLNLPFWMCHSYRLAVLCEAVSRSTSIPAVFYLDAVRTSAMSLLNKMAHITAGGYTSKARPWFCGVGDPGTGKSHAADPLQEVVEEVCAENPAYSVGEASDGYHVVRGRTYSAFEDKLRDTGGYALLLHGEGSPYLCPSYPAKGTFDDGKGLLFDRLLDTAYGKQFGGETKKYRDAAKKSKKVGGVIPAPYLKDTNVAIGMIIQDSVWRSWWASAEAQRHEGLASRFLFAFARARQIGDLRHQQFFVAVFRPMVKKTLASILERISPQFDVLDPAQQKAGVWKFSENQERMFKGIRMIFRAMQGRAPQSRRKLSVALAKVGYWLPLVAWENDLLNSAIAAACGSKPEVDSTDITTPSFNAAVFFALLRYATAQGVLDNDIAKAAVGP